MPFTVIRNLIEQPSEENIAPDDTEFVAISGDILEISVEDLEIKGHPASATLNLWRLLDDKKQFIASLPIAVTSQRRFSIDRLGGGSPKYAARVELIGIDRPTITGEVLGRGVTGISGGNGENGATLETGTTAVTGLFSVIEIIEDAVFASIQGNWDGDPITGRIWKEGKILWGTFTQFQLSSGVVAAYKR